jgi:hypothetical protein
MPAIMLLVVIAAMFVGWQLDTRAVAQDQPMLTVFTDPDTGCEYLRGEALRGGPGSIRSSSTSLTPRMEGFGIEYRHRGCRL